MATFLLWAGTIILMGLLGILIFQDLRFRNKGPHIDAVARVTGHREERDEEGKPLYFSRLTFADNRDATYEISSVSATRRPVPIGKEVAIHYPAGRPDLARERDRGRADLLTYGIVTAMLIAFATAALIGF